MASIFSRRTSCSSVTCICALKDERTIARIAIDEAITDKDDKVFRFSQSRWATLFEGAAQRSGLSVLEPTLYQRRHGGASHDSATRSRTTAEVKKRGRWLDDRSLVRYEAAARVQSSWKAYRALLLFEHMHDTISQLCINLLREASAVRIQSRTRGTAGRRRPAGAMRPRRRSSRRRGSP